MPQRTTCLLVALGLCLLLTPVSMAQELLVAPDNALGIYQPGQTIRWKVQVKGADVTEAAFTVKTGGLTELTKGRRTWREEGLTWPVLRPLQRLEASLGPRERGSGEVRRSPCKPTH